LYKATARYREHDWLIMSTAQETLESLSKSPLDEPEALMQRLLRFENADAPGHGRRTGI